MSQDKLQKQNNEKGGSYAWCCSIFHGKGFCAVKVQGRHCPGSFHSVPFIHATTQEWFLCPALPSKVFSDAPPSHFRSTVLNFWCPDFFSHQYILCHLPESLICSLSIGGESYNWSISTSMPHKDTLKDSKTVWIPTCLKFIGKKFSYFSIYVVFWGTATFLRALGLLPSLWKGNCHKSQWEISRTLSDRFGMLQL